ncbi:cyclase family protein [Dehalogenimonas sp. THU2]|uniref:cyclase family protein n=1 Tax=Dehalogenimonas sp. THU2 TaxID=3151121 RepID=UPI003218B2B6
MSTYFDQWIDISVTLCDGMVHWPGDPPVRIERVQDLAKGDSHTLSQLTMGSHSGTHVDAPAHFLKGAAAVDELDPGVLLGPARVVEIDDMESIKPEELVRHRLRKGERILFKTHNSALWKERTEFNKDFVYITVEAASYLAERDISAVGVDYLSVGGYHKDGGEVHRTLLGAGIWIIEGLDLSGVSAGRYQLACLPLKIGGGDGAPARAVLRRLPGRK